ncbi:hypothetical protein EB796_005884 [Bugula neritina]|uniref:Uncharacterized protein n=1 Tax=Bugula neritina TaxID=10212 RepID=A0A7J7KBY8_BUGNE|nr:hypothetical protein EB796_005884 [Bugula neritina]
MHLPNFTCPTDCTCFRQQVLQCFSAAHTPSATAMTTPSATTTTDVPVDYHFTDAKSGTSLGCLYFILLRVGY